MAGFQFYLQSEKERKVGWVEDDGHALFDKTKIPGEKRKCEVLSFCDATASSFVA
jgi:hypothetical protein